MTEQEKAEKYDNLHPRVKRLLAKDRDFIVIGEHEPYYMEAYSMIREHEQSKGTWNEEDRIAFAAAQLSHKTDKRATSMMTWTCNDFKGVWPVGTALVVTAENVDLAIILVENELKNRGLEQHISREQLIPLPTHHRHVRILADGDY